MQPTELHAHLQETLTQLQQNYPEQPEFIQAVTEVLEDVNGVYHVNKTYQNLKIAQRLAEPDRIISFRINWEDDNGNVQVNRGWRVQYCNALGPYKGGIRFHPTVTPSVLKFLGFEQTFKNALTGLPLGGGKGGSDFDPKGKSDAEIRRFCYAFMRELYTFIGAREDVPAGDINVGSREIGYLFAMYKNLTHQFTGVLTGKGIAYGGSQMRTEATGFGVVYFLQAMLKQVNDSIEGKKVLVSGSGNVALHALQKAINLGATVVSVSDSKGCLYCADGFTQDDVVWLKQQRDQRQPLADFVHQFGRGEWFAGQKPWHLPADIALPCATQNEVNSHDAKNLLKNGVQYVVEGANMPLTAEATAVIRQSNVSYAPGKAANAGGVALSGLEMSQNWQGQYQSFSELDEQLHQIMQHIHELCMQYGKQKDGVIDYMKGANIAGFSKVADALCGFGLL